MSEKNIRLAVLFLVILQVSVVTAFGQKSSIKKTPAPKSASGQLEMEIKIFFTNPKLPEFENSCSAGEFVKRKIPVTRQVAAAALRQVFAGPTAEEQAKGMESISPLGAFYIGVSIKKGVAVINFRPGAEKYLHVNGPICMSDTWLAPMVQTLKQFPPVKSVDFAINGKIIEDWDA
jgi:hypothetical protein